MNGAPRRVFICRSQEVTLADLPLIPSDCGLHRLAHQPGRPAACFEWANRDLVSEFFGGTAQMFQNSSPRSRTTSSTFSRSRRATCARRDLDGQDHQAAGALAADPECFLPDGALSARALLARRATAVREREELPRRGRRRAQHAARGRQRALRPAHVHLAQRRRGGAALRPAQRARLRDRLRGGPHQDELGPRVHLDRRRALRGRRPGGRRRQDRREQPHDQGWTGRTFIRRHEPEPHLPVQLAVVLQLPVRVRQGLSS